MPKWAETALRQLLRLAPDLVSTVEHLTGERDRLAAELEQLRADVDQLAEHLARVQIETATTDAAHEVDLEELERRVRKLRRGRQS